MIKNSDYSISYSWFIIIICI